MSVLTEEEVKQRAEWLKRAESCRAAASLAYRGAPIDLHDAAEAVTGDDLDALTSAAGDTLSARATALRNAALTGIPPEWERPAPENADRAQIAALAEQPAPQAGMGDVWASLIPGLPAILQPYAAERRRQGIERYGTPLQPHNGRDALYDALQEAMDLLAYLRQAEIEAGEYSPEGGEISVTGNRARVVAGRLASQIERRGVK